METTLAVNPLQAIIEEAASLQAYSQALAADRAEVLPYEIENGVRNAAIRVGQALLANEKDENVLVQVGQNAIDTFNESQNKQSI